MTLTLKLDPQLEEQLRQEAARLGVGADDYAVRAISERLRQSQPLPPHLNAQESHLLERINLGLSQQEWARYHVLSERLQDEAIEPDERDEFVTLADRIEANNVLRLQALIELSRLRCIPLEQLMRDLGIRPLDSGDGNE